MKLSKTLVCALAMGTMTFAISKVQAVPGPITLSGYVLVQDYNKKTDYGVIKKSSINQKKILQMLAIATGDASITNKSTKTKLYYDPDAFNDNAYYSNQGAFNVDGGFDFYGVFYYSNSVAGRVDLDGTDIDNDYYSYIELDSYAVDSEFSDILGFVTPYGTEYNSVANEGKNKVGITGNAILYIHSDQYYYNLPGADNTFDYSTLYYANNYYGTYNDYALVIRGSITFNASINSADTKETESFTLKGSGDGMWYTSDSGEMPLVVNGQAKFSGKGAPEL